MPTLAVDPREPAVRAFLPSRSRPAICIRPGQTTRAFSRLIGIRKSVIFFRRVLRFIPSK